VICIELVTAKNHRKFAKIWKNYIYRNGAFSWRKLISRNKGNREAAVMYGDDEHVAHSTTEDEQGVSCRSHGERIINAAFTLRIALSLLIARHHFVHEVHIKLQ